MRRSILLSVGVCLLFATMLGCDGYLATKGRVYASAEADSSRIYVDEPFPNIDGFVRIDSAVVWVFDMPAEQTFDTTRHITWSERTLSGHCGFFSTGGTTRPWPFVAAINVQRSGFKSAVRQFHHDSTPAHRVLIALAPLPGTVFPPPPPALPCP